MRFSLINANNIIVTIIEANSYEEAKRNESYNPAFILVPSEEYHVKGLDLNTYRPLSIKEKLSKGLIKLEDNQVYDKKNNYIISLGRDQEYKNGEVVTLTILEQYKKGVITEEEYLEKTNSNRQVAYKEQTDDAVIKLMRSYLNNNKDKLTKEEKAMLELINSKIKTIKEENPKETNSVKSVKK